MRVKLWVCVVVLAVSGAAAVAAGVDDVLKTLDEIVAQQISGWRFFKGDPPGAEGVDFDDSSWETVDPVHVWRGEGTVAWFRKTLVVPEKIAGMDITGSRLGLDIEMDDEAEVYVNGKHVTHVNWTGRDILLTGSAVPKSRIVVAVKGINHGGPGRLLHASLNVSALSPLRGAAERLASDIRLARDMASRSSDEAMMQAVQAAAAAVDTEALAAGDDKTFLASLDAAEEALTPVGELAKSYTVHLVGHAHIDMNWLWEWPETVEVCRKTFTDMLDLIGRFPGFRFSQSQAAVYEAMRQGYPELFARIRRQVKAGRWEITGGKWTEGDTNMPSGEAIARSILYAKRYFRQRFGVDVKIDWEPDTFGHAWTIPQILRKAGITRYYFARCGRGVPLFWWEGPDGSRVLAYNHGSYNDQVTERIARLPLKVESQTGLRIAMLPYGVGDHGGGPRMSDIETALALQKRVVFPKVEFSTTDAFFSQAEADPDGIPVIKDELNFVFPGCWTTHADIKRMNRRSEVLFPEAEIFSALATQYGLDYPREDLVHAWQVTAFNQFHDILCGSAIHASYDYSRQLFENASHAAMIALQRATKTIASQIGTRGRGVPVVVFNPLSWKRTDVVVMDPPVDVPVGRSVIVTGPDGRKVPAQMARGEAGPELVFIAEDVPAIGYAVYHVRAGRTYARTGDEGVHVRGDGGVENEHLAFWVDETSGTLSRVLLKASGREVFPDGKADLLQMLYEKPHDMSAWNIGEIARTVDLDKAESVELIEQGPARAVVRVRHRGGSGSSFVQDITLYARLPRIDFRMTADWQEVGGKDVDAPMLKVSFPIPQGSVKARFEIPFGSIVRDTTGREVPAQKWIDVSTRDFGVGLLNDCKYGHDVSPRAMRLTLFRSSYDPDPVPDRGVHRVTYSIYPHEGGWDEAGVANRAYELNYPLLAVRTDRHRGSLPAEHSFISVEPDGIIVTAVKLAEDNDDIIVRAYESRGRPTTARFTWGLPVSNVRESDIMEWEDLGPVVLKDGTCDVRFGKWDIRTLRLTRRR